jgi:glycosyltransferase involved in cell wall biosynthesis
MSEVEKWPVMVLAHNEEQKIIACLESLREGEPEASLEVFVMANGCTDRTEDLVRNYARSHPWVHLVSIRLGDKCNAWNVFIHDIVPATIPDRNVYFFMDGDARIAPRSLSVLAKALGDDAHAHAASAVPGSGRNRARDRTAILEERGLVANLYALRGSFVRRLRERGVRLPLKLEGDDGLLGALIKWNLDPRGDWDDRLIHPCDDAKFLFDSVPMTDPKEWSKYWKRLVRYGRRYYEFQLLRQLLRERGIGGLPEDIQSVYSLASQLPYVWRGIYTPAFAVALRQMRRIGQQNAPVRVSPTPR